MTTFACANFVHGVHQTALRTSYSIAHTGMSFTLLCAMLDSPSIA